MKRRELLKKLEAKGWYFKRHGGDHDVYTDGVRTIAVPRHSEINELLARAIIRKIEGDMK